MKFSVNVKNLSKRYGVKKVFHNISFSHTEGVLGIAGANGSGKSTLLQCLAGLQRASSGSVEWYAGKHLVKLNTLQKSIGYVAPYINMYDGLSCAENLDFLLKLRGVKPRKPLIHKSLQKTNIEKLSGQLFGNLSTGQQQRMRIAGALIHQPEVLLLDEPGSNLDEAGRRLIQNFVTDFKGSGKMAFIASNNPAELKLCDRVYSVEEEEFL